MAELSDVRYKWWLGDLLELGILVAMLVFMAVIYIPRSIWDEENEIRDESRFRMENVYDILSFFETLTGDRTADPLLALRVINAARDSLTADSTFLGPRHIILDGENVLVDMYSGYGASFDTSFGYFRTRKDTLVDTVLTVVRFNRELSLNDTSFVRLEEIDPFLEDTTLVGIPDTAISTHIEVVSYYESYMPDSSMLFCPLTNLPYIVEAGEEGLKVESPIVKSYEEPRYLLFSFRAESHGSVENAEKSWARF
ncbi:MAG: hypothetical protein V3U24_01130 [Candidatus Neomarinimicrobiota bacterium]